MFCTRLDIDYAEIIAFLLYKTYNINMKNTIRTCKNKKAFTLAEVLIVIGIIGIVAAMTIPPLINNTNNAELKTMWKKKFSEIAYINNLLINDSIYPAEFRLDAVDAYEKYLSYSKKCTNSQTEGCWHQLNNWVTYANVTVTNPALDTRGYILNDGSLLLIPTGYDFSSTPYLPTHYSGVTPLCLQLVVDVNGFKGPNKNGADIFGAILYGNTTKPGVASGLSTNCNKTDTNNSAWAGLDCAKKVILGEDY